VELTTGEDDDRTRPAAGSVADAARSFSYGWRLCEQYLGCHEIAVMQPPRRSCWLHTRLTAMLVDASG
jgi:hypothetical protein